MWTGDGCQDRFSQLFTKRAIQFGMSLNRGPHDDLAADIQLAIQILRASLQVRKFGSGLFVPFQVLDDPLMECFSLLAHECLPLGLAFRK